MLKRPNSGFFKEVLKSNLKQSTKDVRFVKIMHFYGAFNLRYFWVKFLTILRLYFVESIAIKIA
jgi:hypothetical protein